jgi:hypothetical protein
VPHLWDHGGDLLSALLHNRPVVWLTTQPHLDLTDEDRAWGRYDPELHQEFLDSGKWMNRPEPTVSLTVRFEVKTNRLAHYRTWLKENPVSVENQNGEVVCDDVAAAMFSSIGFMPSRVIGGFISARSRHGEFRFRAANADHTRLKHSQCAARKSFAAEESS